MLKWIDGKNFVFLRRELKPKSKKLTSNQLAHETHETLVSNTKWNTTQYVHGVRIQIQILPAKYTPELTEVKFSPFTPFLGLTSTEENEVNFARIAKTA